MTADDEPSVMQAYVNCTYTFHKQKHFGSLFFEGRLAFFSLVTDRFRVCGSFDYMVGDSRVILMDVGVCGDIVLVKCGESDLEIQINVGHFVTRYSNQTPQKLTLEHHSEWWDTELARKAEGLQLDD